MDGREAAKVIPGGSSQYFLHKGAVSSAEPGFRAMAPHDVHWQSSIRPNFAGIPFPADASLGNFTAHGSSVDAVPSSEPVKKKRGRPLKYGPKGKVPHGLLPSLYLHVLILPPGLIRCTPRKQRLAAMGKWMNNSAGHAFSPHVITVRARETTKETSAQTIHVPRFLRDSL